MRGLLHGPEGVEESEAAGADLPGKSNSKPQAQDGSDSGMCGKLAGRGLESGTVSFSETVPRSGVRTGSRLKHG